MLNLKMQLPNPLGSCLWVFTVLQICLPASLSPKIWLRQSLAISPFTYETRGRIKKLAPSSGIRVHFDSVRQTAK